MPRGVLRASSLRRHLLLWVLVPLASAVAVMAWLAYKSSRDTATVVQDQLLLGSARMIAEQISFEDGTFQHQIPPAALELFQSGELDHIYYRVTTGAGILLAGYTDLPTSRIDPPSIAQITAPFFFAASMRGEPVRIVAFYQPVIGNPSALPVVVEVAQTTNARQKLTRDLWLRTLAQQLLILALATVFILYGLRRGLQPLVHLRDDVRARTEGSLQPLQTSHVPSELTPVMEAFNDYIVRLETYTRQRTTFVQNAAHQLRTPLAVLNTQISDAERADRKSDGDQSLSAARTTLQQTTRLVNQFLTLSSAEASQVQVVNMTTQEVCDVVQTVMESLALQAHTKEIDLGFERLGTDANAAIDPGALHEIVTNVLENAIRYTPAKGIVTARVRSAPSGIDFSVEDNGPGVPVSSRARLFERFFRAEGVTQSGSGLGLAIVKEWAQQCGGTVQATSPAHGGHGLLVTVRFFARAA